MEICVVDIVEEGGRQVIYLPEDFRIEDKKVYLRKTGNMVSLVPYGRPWENFYDSLEEFTPDYLEVRDVGDDDSEVRPTREW